MFKNLINLAKRGFVGLCLVLACWPAAAADDAAGKVADKPLFRDPVFDGAADPSLVFNPETGKWWMFYTNRRATAEGLRGVEWVHGTKIGIAESADGGATWSYVGAAEIDVPVEIASGEPTFWAPEVTRVAEGQWRMYLTVVPGVFADWSHPRRIVELRSDDLLHWTDAKPLPLANEKVIDATVLQTPSGKWRLWYNNERDGKSIWQASSDDLTEWTDRGKAIGQRGEGPKVFRWRGKYWLVMDLWRGIGVFRSDDADNWEQQPTPLLAEPGVGEDDQVIGQHPDVVVSGDRAFMFYFTHPGRRGPDARKDTAEQRRSSIQVVELHERDGWLTCDRDAPTHVRLLAE
ncbi:Glycosyl hydrolases family 43 [Posidoniimonas corsicana]|uniref:Glycosyl hydrolases family 43 n=1 Tax=Posidoniimonas corsicana TaxID=1938618 RepID=A0A5C5VAC0_9BACT|nr:family 43 glycosylhydrolase [Posidoniimonas corsicana]TWT35554.1 Glycosyl hydrolases family 43 [Posidoniimonas corsicana]